ncbi:tRNA lysidine(34) synthetase TilS [Tsuneonella sp. HG249]
MGVAVSGGPDSLALLLLANAALPGRVIAATVDHRLREENAAEARTVAEVCRERGIPHETLTVAVEAGNLQDRARDARYTALCSSFAQRGARVFATAHHADDQAETVLMRLGRGSGLSGLAGIRARRIVTAPEPLGGFLVARPLLDWRRAELAAVVEHVGLVAADDPSNDDARFDRVQMRRRLADMPWLDPFAIARSAALLQEAEDAIADAAAVVMARAVHRDGSAIWFEWGHSRLIEIEVVGAILRELGAEAPRSAIAQMVGQLTAEHHSTLAGVMARRAFHRKEPGTQVDAWKFERENPRRSG